MGRVSAPFGVKGWIRLSPFTAERRGLLDYPHWWLGRGGEWRLYTVNEGHEQGSGLVAKLEGCEDRDAAARLAGLEVAVARNALPAPGHNEFYWTDLIGLRVENDDERDLGMVTRVMETGANEVLVVAGDVERLIPFIAEVIRKVDIASGVIRVNWGVDY